jgi:hypothetical protein
MTVQFDLSLDLKELDKEEQMKLVKEVLRDFGGLRQFLDLLLDILPHMAMEREGQFAKRTDEDRPFEQFLERIILFTATNRTGEG